MKTCCKKNVHNIQKKEVNPYKEGAFFMLCIQITADMKIIF